MDGLVSRRHLSLDLALSLLARVREEADARDLSLAAAVVDDSGQVVASQRMDGAALAARLQAEHPDLPILIITGYTGRTDDVLHLPRLAKPFGQADIAAALAALLTDDNVVRLPRKQDRGEGR